MKPLFLHASLYQQARGAWLHSSQTGTNIGGTSSLGTPCGAIAQGRSLLRLDRTAQVQAAHMAQFHLRLETPKQTDRQAIKLDAVLCYRTLDNCVEHETPLIADRLRSLLDCLTPSNP